MRKQRNLPTFDQNVCTVYSNIHTVYPSKNHVTTHPVYCIQLNLIDIQFEVFFFRAPIPVKQGQVRGNKNIFTVGPRTCISDSLSWFPPPLKSPGQVTVLVFRIVVAYSNT